MIRNTSVGDHSTSAPDGPRRLAVGLLVLLTGYTAIAGLFVVLHRLDRIAFDGLVRVVVIAILVIAAFALLPIDRWGPRPIIIASGVAALMWAVLARTIPVSDFSTFYQLSERLAEGSLRALWQTKSSPTVAIYGAIFWLFGSSMFVVWAVGALLHAIQTYLVYLVAREIPVFRPSAALSAAMFGLLPSLVGYAPVMSSEGIFMTLTLVGTLLALRWRTQPRAWLIIGAGFAFGMSFLARGIGVAFMIGAVTFVVVAAGVTRWRVLLQSLALLGIGTAIALLPQLSLNVMYGQEWSISSSSIAPLSFMFGTNQGTNGGFSREDLEQIGWKPGQTPSEREVVYDRAISVGLGRITADPVGFVWFAATDKMARLWEQEAQIVRTWSVAEDRRDVIDGQRIGLWVDSWYAAFLAMVLFGLFAATRVVSKGRWIRPLDTIVLLILPLLVVASIHGVLEVQPRYHIVFLPTLSLFSGFAVLQSKRFTAQLGSRASMPASVVD